ncbi:MAG TPA: hypothetical protein VK111_14085 [Virgibacillus sp.]|nr:hypothetical protein [Virgibacillus sp.]
MDFLKRLILYIFIVLLCISIYSDITGDSSPYQPRKAEEQSHRDDVSIVKIKVKPGDTVLSITEQINTFSNKQVNIEHILADFKQKNPNADPNNLHVNEYYYFLRYDDM